MFRLALALGRTVGELLDSVSYLELLRWGEYYSIEPFGEWRGDVRSAQIAAVIANVNRDPKKRSKPFELQDFMPFQKLASKPKTKVATAKIAPETIQWLFAKVKKQSGQ